MPQHTIADTTPTRTRTYDHVPATSANIDMMQDAPTDSGMQWHGGQYDPHGYPGDDNTEQDHASIVSDMTTPDQKFDGQQTAELAVQVDVSLKDAVAAFRISKEKFQVHPTLSQRTRELAEEVFRLTHGGDTWMETMVESAVEAARCATRDYDELKGMISGLVGHIQSLEDRLNARIDHVQNTTITAIKSIPNPTILGEAWQSADAIAQNIPDWDTNPEA
ncbi:hypothetical protein R3P38DRAFT_2795123 [Favolaschia claudopus]|uniref:Uncharacterized protein n=1 Tax=Favolaschia claudopus TaxID=2862362 RepID=A0AAW0A8D3_9AGAR